MSSRILTPEEIQLHNRSDDCWIVVHSKVFDVTNFLDLHPGGSSIILKYAGDDATSAYDEIHAPGIIEETLAAETFIGMLENISRSAEADQKHAIKGDIAASTSTDTVSAQSTVTNTAQVQPYSKPDLGRLISVHHFAAVAEKTFSPKAWAFFSSAATDLVTHKANHEYFRRIMIKPRILKNVLNVSTRRTILGCESDVPFFVSPAAMAKLAHRDGELCLARGCANAGVIQCISSNASFPLSSIVSAGRPKQPFFLQLYVNSDRTKTKALLQKARDLGIRAIFVTVDAPVAGKREADELLAAEAVASAISGAVASNDKKGGGMGRIMAQYVDKTLVWEDIKWISETSGLPVVLKGIQTATDAKMAAEYGCAGILLSNHGGRSLDTVQPCVLTLLELHRSCPEVFSQIEVYIDGGVTRGSDILKCLALGATAVGVGRPYLYALAYGDEGVEHLTSILKDELETSMRLCGVTDVDQLHPGLVNTREIDHLISEGEAHPYITWMPKAKI